MSTVKDADKIDLITYSEPEKKLILVMVEPRRWCSDNQMYEELSEKLKNYLTFIEDGELEERYPGLEIDQIKIELLSSDKLTDHAAEVVSSIKKRLKHKGYEFEFRVI